MIKVTIPKGPSSNARCWRNWSLRRFGSSGSRPNVSLGQSFPASIGNWSVPPRTRSRRCVAGRQGRQHAVASHLENIRRLQAALDKQFRLPKPVEFPKLLQSVERDVASAILVRHRKVEADLRETMKAMSTPWLNMQHEIRSLTGLAGLNKLGQILKRETTFEIAPAKHVRSLLGDWRNKIDWPAEIFTDPVARSDFYLDRGLEPALTDFPAEAFHEVLSIAGIKGSPRPAIDADNRTLDLHQDEEEAGFERNNTAHDRLQRFETRMRQFISEEMERSGGQNWVENRIPPEIVEKWKDKQSIALDKGERPRPLIAYADFTDYERIILNKQNWPVFAPFFRRQTSVQESLQRLYPIRICTMHARFITQDDELYLRAETQRLSLAMEQRARTEGEWNHTNECSGENKA